MKIIAIIIAFVLILSMVLSFASVKMTAREKMTIQSVTESDADGAGTGTLEEASEKIQRRYNRRETKEYDFSKVTPVGTSGAVYAGAPDGFNIFRK